MEPTATQRYESRLVAFSKFSGILSVIVGAAVLIGWALDIPSVKSILPGLVTMKANTALCFILIGISMLLCHPQRISAARRLLAQSAGGIVALVGLLTFCEYLFGWNAGIDQILFREDAGAVLTVSPGRMAFSTAFNFTMIGIALIILDAQNKRGYWPSQTLLVVSGTISFLAFIGYLYGVKSFYFGVGRYTAMALHTTALFIFVSAGILFARPRRGLISFFISDTISGMIVRRLLPVAVLIPLLLGRFKLGAERVGLMTNEFGGSFVATANAIFIAVYIFWLVRVVNRVVISRDIAQRESINLEERYRALFQETTDSIFIHDMTGKLVEVNNSACERLGYSRDEMLAKSVKDIDSPEYAALVQVRIAKLIRDKSLMFDSAHVTRDGKIIPVEISSQVIEYNGRPAIFSIARDVTERKRIEEDLRGKIHDLEVFNKISVDRELKMVELKKKIEELERKVKKP